MTHAEVRELLEGYALRALDDAERSAIERHLASCDECRAVARDLERVADVIPEALGERAPSAALRDRVLRAAEGQVAGTVRPRFALPALRPAWALSGMLAVLSLASLALALDMQREVATLRAERDEYAVIVERVSQGGRWWYMQGLASFAGSGGTLIDPRKDGPAFVLFHDLKPIQAGTQYAIWLIRADGSWARAVNFAPSGEVVQRVDVPLPVSDFVQCSVTVESAPTGPRRGAVAMQSRNFTQ